MKDAEMMRTKIVSKVVALSKSDFDNAIPDFIANGSRVVKEGWLLADPQAKGEDIILPKLKVSDPLSLINLNNEQKQTEPPNRYSEAGLIKELEKKRYW